MKFCHTVTICLFLLKTFELVLKAPRKSCIETSPAVCESFLHFIVDKVTSLRAQVVPQFTTLQFLCFFCCFPHLWICDLAVFGPLKQTGSPDVAIPSSLSKDVFPALGPSEFALVISIQSSCVVPENQKHAVIQPMIKKPSVLDNYRPISKLQFLSKIPK